MKRRRGIFLVIVAVALANAANSSAHPNPKMQAQERELGTTTLLQPLHAILARQPTSGNPVDQAVSRGIGVTSAPGIIANLQVDSLDGELLDQLRALGADIRFSSAKYGAVTLAVESRAQLLNLARLPGVLSVTGPEPRIRRSGAVQSRAPEALRVSTLRSDGHDGSGRALGILSDSFARSANVRDANTTPAAGAAGNLQGSRPQDSGDLPALVSLLQEGEAGGSDEGAAMAELAYDIAPGLGLTFHSVGSSRASFASAIDTLCDSRHASVLVDDIGFLLEPYYQDGLIAQAASNCVARGIPFVSAIGNDGDAGYRQTYVDINPGMDDAPAVAPFSPSGVDLHDWGGGDGFLEIEVPAAGEVIVVLQWNQPHASTNGSNGAQIDLDLYATLQDSVSALNSQSPNFVDRSISAQGDTGQPLGDAVEFLTLTADPNAATTFFIAVDHYTGSQDAIPQSATTPLEFRLLFLGDLTRSEYAFNGPTAWGHPLAEGIISVAAVAWWEAPDFAPDRFGTPDIDPQPYSSRAGDIAIQFDRQGNFAPVVRFAPTLAGVDGNNTSFFGSDFSAGSTPGFGEPDGAPNFFGTSAAAPNVAAVVILLQQAFPGLTPRTLADGLIATAIDVSGARASSGTDDVSGAGLIDAGAAHAFLKANLPQPSVANAAAGSSGGGGGGCFIATAAYGSYWSREVRRLREFRDRTLSRSVAGRWLIEQYYALSPPLANAIHGSDSLRALVRYVLTPLVWMLEAPWRGTLLLVTFFIFCYSLSRIVAARFNKTYSSGVC